MRIPWAVSFCVLVLASTSLGQTIYPKGTTIWNPLKTDDGYTVFRSALGDCVMIDMNGQVVNKWSSPNPDFIISHIDPLENGSILAFEYDPAELRRKIIELSYDNQVLWSYQLGPSFPANTAFHHDSERLANGNTLILAVQDVDVPAISDKTLRDDFLMEVDPAGDVVWVWHSWQHFDEFGFDAESKQLIFEQGGDWAHVNSISVIGPNHHADPAFAEGNIIVSQRFTNIVFIIDRVSGAVVWQLGPEQDQVTYGQHFPHMIPMGYPGEGNILIFDNGSGTGYPLNGRSPGNSSVPEVDPITKEVVWRYTATMSGQFRHRFTSYIVSGAQRLQNGNTLICSGVKGRLFEVTSDGEIVWEYMSPFASESRGEFVYRAYRVPYDWVE